MSTQSKKSLLIAVLFQAVKDLQSAKYQAEVKAFINSEEFVWLWEQVNEDVVGLPDAQTVREQIGAGRVCIPRGAYHRACDEIVYLS